MAKKSEEKSITTVMAEENMVEETMTEETAAADDAKEETSAEETVNEGKKSDRVPYLLPRHVLTDESHKLVIVNGVAYQVKCGEMVEVPRKVAQALDDAIMAAQRAEETQAATQKAGEDGLYSL